jgi:hypothetical protein
MNEHKEEEHQDYIALQTKNKHEKYEHIIQSYKALI